MSDLVQEGNGYVRRLLARIEALEAALKTCADKLEKCALAGGNDKWAVDELVKPFRAAAALVGQGWTPPKPASHSP